MGGVPAVTSGLNSTNTLDGIVPSATITVYLTGTQTLATIYADKNNTPLSNPFTSNSVGFVNPGGYIFWAAVNQGYDIVASGGISPNTYAQSVPLCTDCYPGFNFSGSGLTLQHNGANNASQTTLNLEGSTGLSVTNPSGGNVLFTPSFQSLTTTGTSGAATLSGGVLNIPNYSAGSSGVTSLNALTGALSITGDSSITVTPSGSSIALHATGSGGSGVQYNPSNTKYFVEGTSQFILAGPAGDAWGSAGICGVGGNTQMNISSGTVSGGVGTFTYSGTTEPSAGNAITLAQFSTAALNQNIVILSTGLTSTTFEANISGFSGSTGTGVGSCTYNVPSQMQSEPFFHGHGTVINYSQQSFLLNQAISDYTTWPTTATSLHALSPAQSGNSPEYLFIALGVQDLLNCATTVGPATTPGTMEYEILQLFALAHADGYIVVASDVPDAAGTGTGCANFEQNRWTFNQWLLTQSQGSNSTTGQYWDQFVPLANVLDDANDTTVYISGNNIHLTESGAKRAAQQYNLGMTSQAGLTSSAPTAQTVNSLNVVNSLCLGQMGTYTYNPACPSTLTQGGATYEAENAQLALTNSVTGHNVYLTAHDEDGGSVLLGSTISGSNQPLDWWIPITGGVAELMTLGTEKCWQTVSSFLPSSMVCLSWQNGFLNLGSGAIGNNSESLALSATAHNTAQTTVTGTTAGTAVWSQPQVGSAFKQAVLYLNGYENTTATAQTVTLPASFAIVGYVVTDGGSCSGVTISTATVTLPSSMSATQTGLCEVKGY